MSPAKAKNAKNNEPQPAEQPKPEKKEKKVKKEKGKQPKGEPFELPILVEIGFSFASVFLILVDLLIAWVSYTSGANWQAIFIRVVITTVAVGFVLWLLAMNISNGSIFAALKTIEEEENDQMKSANMAGEHKMEKTAGTEA